jgi:flagellar biosynthesis/type III secretory pathway M-ring protein FliF/YscJ
MAAALPVTADAAPAAVAATGLDVDAIESRVERSLAKKVCKLIDDFPERALDVVRGWMAADR